jgi:hypothetical protein
LGEGAAFLTLTTAVPYETNFVQPLSAFAVHFVSVSALHRHPMAKMERTFDVDSGHVAMPFAGFERLQSRKRLFPPPLACAPDKIDLIKLRFPSANEVILGVALNGNPLAEPIAILFVKTGDIAMPLALSKRKKGGNAPIPSFFSNQPFALSNHHKVARITLH